jgi:tetratricopeptide (TPR) repeat protein
VGDYGWPGLFVVLLGLAHVAWRLLRSTFRQTNEAQAMIPAMMLALLAAASVHAVFDYTAHMPANMLALCLVMGTLYGRGLQRGIWGAKPLSSRWSLFLARLAAGTAPVLALSFVPLALGAWAEYRLEGARQANNTRGEILRARDMQRWVPMHWRGWREEALHHRREAFWTVDPDLRAQRTERSREFYTKALRWNPLDRISLLGLVQLEMREGRHDAAIPLLEELTALDPLDAHTKVQLGLALRETGRLEEALAAFQDAKRIRGKPDRQIELNISYLRDLLRSSSTARPTP